VAAWASLPLACGGDADLGAGESGAGAGSATGAAQGGSGTSQGGAGTSQGGSSYVTGAGGAPTVQAPCQGHIYQCGDLIDNDGDGLIDSQDPDCLGPCDNTEDSYHGGIPGQNNAPCKMDCYFDQDTGTGNDDCYWNHKCDPHETAPSYYPEPWNGALCAYDPAAKTPGTNKTCAELDAAQSQLCLDYCGPLTPNGCDCFGCCELPAGGGKFVWLGSVGANENTVCTQAAASDPAVCHPCKPVTACLNDCGKCEYCLGKTTLPPECFDPEGTGGAGGASGNNPDQCLRGVQPCGGPNQLPCPAGQYCITGCCQQVPL
jgi:hypothetical protein